MIVWNDAKHLDQSLMHALRCCLTIIFGFCGDIRDAHDGYGDLILMFENESDGDGRLQLARTLHLTV
jgi:hypothetical protein